MATRHSICALYLVSIIFFWRFQLPVGGAAFPIYFFLSPFVLYFARRSSLTHRWILAVFLIGLTIYFPLAQGVEFGRLPVTIASWVMLTTSFFAIGIAIMSAAEDNWKSFAKALRWSLFAQLAFQFADIANINILQNRLTPHYFFPISRPTGLLIEPSHVALALSPLIFASFWPRANVFCGNLTRLDFCLVYLSVALCPSVTAIVVIFLALAIRISVASRTFFVAALLPLIVVSQDIIFFASFLPPQIEDRVVTLVEIFRHGEFDNHSNMSSIVFYGGFEAAASTLRNYPLGVGLMNMASAYDLSDFYLYREVAGSKNIHDGSSILFKLVTEFGYFGLVFSGYALLTLYFFLLRAAEDISVGVLAFPLVASFLRGSSYFDGAVIISLSLFVFGLGFFSNRRGA